MIVGAHRQAHRDVVADTRNKSFGDGMVFDTTQAPLRAVELVSNGRWLATDDDPQFHVVLGAPQSRGVFLITARLYGEGVRNPCVYLDLGDGWSEASRFDLRPDAGGAQWSAEVDVPMLGASMRLDPSDAAGEFVFAGVIVRQLATVPDPAGTHVLPLDMLRYRQWVARHDTLSPAQLRALRRAASRMDSRPLLSLLLSVHDGDAGAIEGLVDSLEAQAYPDWELCLHAADPLGGAAVIACRQMARRSSRVRIVDVKSDGDFGSGAGIATGLAAVRGLFCAVVDAHLRVRPHGLLLFANAITQHGDVGMVFADDDRIDPDGNRADPYFKPEWDPLLALMPGYPGPLCFHRIASLRAACRAGATTAYALQLHLGSSLAGACAVHIPHVATHTLAVDGGHRPVDDAAVLRELSGYLARTDPAARLDVLDGVPRVRRSLPASTPKVSIVIPTRDRVDLLRRCVDSILERSTYANFEIVIVDNQSSDPATLAYLDTVQSDARVRVLVYDEPFNYSAVNNHAVERVDGKVIALLNNDVEVITASWIEEMLQYALRPDVGAVGAMLYYPDDTIQHAGVVVGLGGVAGHAYSHQPRGFSGQRGRARQVQRLGAVTAACLLVRREAYLQVGGLDESLAIAFNDVDFCLRLARAGLTNVWTPFAELYHHESASRGTEDTPEKQARFAREVNQMLARWSVELVSDPAYHPNLSLAFNGAFALADPPRAPLVAWIDAMAMSGRCGRVQV